MIEALAEGATSNASTLAWMLVMFAAGAMCPTYYAQERFRGFGRAVVSRLPYQPPPGMEEEAALEEATDE